MKTILMLIAVASVLFLQSLALAEEVYEKDGCIYIVGNLTTSQKQASDKYYQKRMVKLEAQRDKELQRNHEIEIEKIKAQAVRDYLEAQATVYGNATAPKDTINVRVNTRSNASAKGGAGGSGSSGDITSTGGTATGGTSNNSSSSTSG